MQKKTLVKMINRELSILTELVESFTDNEEIHPIEINLALSKTKDIYDELILLRDGNKATTSNNTALKKETKPIIEATKTTPDSIPVPNIAIEKKEIQEKEPEITEPAAKVVKEEIPVIDNTPAQPVEEKIIEQEIVAETEDEKLIEPDAIKVEKVIEKEPEVIIEKPQEKIVIEHKNTVTEEQTEPEQIKPEAKESTADQLETDSNSGIIADRFQHNGLSINETLASFKKNKDLASRLQDSPITDLKRSIKINDRIWFINELFEKNADLYSQTLENINSSPDLDVALSKLFSEFSWDQEKKSTIAFLELVFRRFAPQ